MKIHQLPTGAHFEYEGEEYVKTGPLFATGKSGQRLIPKYAVLRPLDGVPDTRKAKPAEALPRAKVLKALEDFCAQCEAIVRDDRRAELDAARDRFLKALDG